ncbi:hypothetical protein BDV24DRAFT_136672 [Aspergillus arachidicola]|uniref:Uncharacterized protein n=1 Tax=Aspergillus arachidicola TaxID=656916 RepID=A0A5N6Y0Y0_9EURO|nr:hypothetical protein BDV24DRAFT_136672 [Aspergillus arachidicola]
MNMYDGDGSIPWIQWLCFFSYVLLDTSFFYSLLFFYRGRRTPNQDSIQGVPVDYGRWSLLRIVVGTAL